MTLQLAHEGDTAQDSSLPMDVYGFKKEMLEQPGLSLCPLLVLCVSIAGHCPASFHLLGWFVAPSAPSHIPHTTLAEIKSLQL